MSHPIRSLPLTPAFPSAATLDSAFRCGWAVERDWRAGSTAVAILRRGINGTQMIGDVPANLLYDSLTLRTLTREGHQAPETGARGYFPGAEVTRAPGANWRPLRDRRYRARAHNATRAVRLAGRLAWLSMGAAPRPMAGGSPWASRDTGWHAGDCPCRACGRNW